MTLTEAGQNQLVIEHMDDLVPAVAAQFRGGEVEFEDLLAAGRVGLVKAARSFDPAQSKFTTWATTKIRSAIMDAIEASRQQWYPKESDVGYPAPIGGDSIERIFEWDAWGNWGNATAIYELWSALDASPEDLAIRYDDIKEKQAKFTAAFISLSRAQRKLITWVFLDEPRKPVTQAARELGVSYFQATRMLNKALKTMREVIARMDMNSGGYTAKGIPSSGLGANAQHTGPVGCASGNTTAA